jgi:3-oxoacyl-[acyl-carrier-protein] synthase-1
MNIYIGAENSITPLGNTAEESFAGLRANISGIKKIKNVGFENKDLYLSRISGTNDYSFDSLLSNCFNAIKSRLAIDISSSGKTLVIISTTKGDIKNEIIDAIGNPVTKLQIAFSLEHTPWVVSNACASGVIAINTGADLIRSGAYENIIVIGCDIISDFVTYGFQSLFAISENPCAPFDKDRTGITLGEGCAGLVLSNNKSIFKEAPMKYVAGTSSNDANHISGPSRTGEGLFRTVRKTLELAGMKEQDIDFISAHGTATAYNDDMESIAFDRLHMDHIPLNSFKGYFGHTLGAAGVIETAMCLQSMRNNLLIKSLGFKNHGTAKQINILIENKSAASDTILKTSSGFGGCNASLVLKRA